MTKEGAIELLEKEKAYMLSHGGDRQAEALDSAIKAMKQDILDEIRAEIIELRHKQNVGVLECLDIINKYKERRE